MSRNVKKAAAALTLTMILSGGGAVYASTGITPFPAEPAPISATVAGPLQILVNETSITESGFYNGEGTEAMLPLRAVAEALGYTLTWNEADYSVDLSKDNIFTNVKTGEDRYAYNKMIKTLGTAPKLMDSKLYVPSSFFSEIIPSTVNRQGQAVYVSTFIQRENVLAKGTITSLRESEKGHKAVQIKGFATDGIVLNVGEDTVFQTADGKALAFSDLAIGMEVEVEHSMAATMSLPPQTAVYKITVLSQLEEKDVIGTSGTIEEARTNDKGEVSLVIKGAGLTDHSPAEVVLQLTEKTVLVNADGEAIEAAQLEKGAKVVGFYTPRLTKSLPPIGTALKVVLVAEAPAEAE
jgi:hypothetical protein